MKMLKLLQEMRGLSELGREHPATKPSALYLMQLRQRRATANRPRQRIEITVDLKDVVSFPEPVRIIHIAAQPVQIPA